MHDNANDCFRSSFVTIVIIIIIPLRWWNCIHCCGIRHRIEDKRQDAWIINKCELYNHTQHSLPSCSSVWILIFSFSSSNAAVAVWNSTRTSISGFFFSFVSFLSFDFGQFVSWNLWHSRESDARKVRDSFLFSRTQSKRHMDSWVAIRFTHWLEPFQSIVWSAFGVTCWTFYMREIRLRTYDRWRYSFSRSKQWMQVNRWYELIWIINIYPWTTW